jgi:3,4-dihydroxy-2-butanone 4-phosphate synthase
MKKAQKASGVRAKSKPQLTLATKQSTAPFAAIDDAVEAVRAGRMIIIVDDADRENEGDLMIAAEKVTPEAINFMARYGRGLVCMPITGERAAQLQLAPMTPVNRSVHAVTKDGKSINGRRLNEDTYTVQLIDEQEHLVSLTKADLREFTVLKTTTMPSYKDKFSDDEIKALVAYIRAFKK